MNMDSTNYPVADIGLARRLERAEGMSNAEFVEARARAFPALDAEWIEIAGTTVMFDGAHSPCTQTFGLGMWQPISADDLQEIESFFATRGAAVYHEVCPLADGSVLTLLNERGYVPIEHSNVMYQPIPGDNARVQTESAIRVRRIERGEESLWAAVAAEGWRDVAEELHQYLLDLGRIIAYRPNSPCFLAELEGEPIAAAAMSAFEGVALMAGACTIPRWRKRGAQQALLRHRLKYAADHGCNTAMVVALPGSASQRNSERNQFRIAYTRTKWSLAAHAERD